MIVIGRQVDIIFTLFEANITKHTEKTGKNRRFETIRLKV